MKKFKLRSGNTTPFKQMGSKDKHTEAKVGAAAMLTKQFPKEAGKYSYTKYLEKAAKASKDPYFKDVLGKKGFEFSQRVTQDKAVEKLMTDKNISRKAFDTKLSKITKTVDPHPKTWKGLQSKTLKGYKPHQVSKGVTFTKRVPSDFIKHKLVEKPLSKIGTKQASILRNAPKVAGKAASRALPVIGEALITYDVLKEGVKRIATGVKTGVPQTKLKGKHIKDTFKRVPKKKYI